MIDSSPSLVRTQADGLAFYQFRALLAEPGLRHGFFTRLGGVSAPPCASLNVGASVGDDPQAVEENRRRCFAALGFAGHQVVSPWQVHSTVVARVGLLEGGRDVPATDGLLTAERGVALFLRFADCVPIALYDRERQAIGLAHAGWRGTLDGMAGEAVAAMRRCFGSRPERLWAGIGPGIGPCCYEVGADLGARFDQRFGPQVLRQEGAGLPHLDLAAANALALREAGVLQIDQAGICTACHTDEFFSHRREGGQTGRLAALIGFAPA